MEAFNRTPTGKSSIHGWIFLDHPTSLAFHWLSISYAPQIRPQWHVQFQAGTRQHHFSNEILGALRDLPGMGSGEQLAMEAMARSKMIYIDLPNRVSCIAVFARTDMDWHLAFPSHWAPCAWERSCNRSPGKANLILRESHWMGGKLGPRHRRKQRDGKEVSIETRCRPGSHSFIPNRVGHCVVITWVGLCIIYNNIHMYANFMDPPVIKGGNGKLKMEVFFAGEIIEIYWLAGWCSSNPHGGYVPSSDRNPAR